MCSQQKETSTTEGTTTNYNIHMLSKVEVMRF